MTKPQTSKATIYVDVDDEITTLIDKVTSTKEKIVALVLPKRATMLQSIVNMKLLKRSADGAGKKIVLITSESNIVPLAGAVGMHVAKTLQSKPVVPTAPNATDSDKDDAVEDVALDKTAPIGKLAGLPEEKDSETEEIQVPEEAGEPKKPAKTKGNRKLKVPNFNKFRTKLILGVLLLVLLISGYVFATTVLPKAEISVTTDQSTFTKDIMLTGSPNVEGVEATEKIVPVKTEELLKKDTETVAASGQKNVGEKATGKMALTNCIDEPGNKRIPSGTSFSRNGKTFVSTEAVTLEEARFAPGNRCVSDSEDVAVIAAEGGESFNIEEGAYTASIAGIQAYGSEMKGGTDEIIKVVSQADIDKARQQLQNRTSEGTVEDLQALLRGQGYVPFESTYKAGETESEVSVEAGTEADAVSVTSSTSYTMAGVLKSGVEQVIKEAATEDIDSQNQEILSTGIDGATIRVLSTQEDGTMNISLETIVVAGPKINADSLKQEILGKKRGETQKIIESRAGVESVEIEYSPFWVNATPKNESKVTIVFVDASEATQTQEEDSE